MPATTTKAITSSLESFSSIFASEIHSLSMIPAKPSIVTPTKHATDTSNQNATGDAKGAFSGIFPNLSVPLIGKAIEQHEKFHDPDTASKIVAGIMYFPMPTTTAVVNTPAGTASKPRSIDIASIVNFSRPNDRVIMAAAHAETPMLSIGNNPSVFIAQRSQMPLNDWGRYQNGHKGGMLADGAIAGISIQI